MPINVFKASPKTCEFIRNLHKSVLDNKFTKEQIADVMFLSADGMVHRTVGHPDDPIIVKFVKNLFGTNPQGKSMILCRW